MQLYFTDRRKVWKAGAVARIGDAELFESRPLAAGTPVPLDDAMRAYAYSVLMLLNFLAVRGLDLRLTTETDVLDFRR